MMWPYHRSSRATSKSGSRGLTMAVRTYFFAKCCPLEEERSASAWKRAECWAWDDPQQCKMVVAKHLFNSGKHQAVTTYQDSVEIF